MNLIIQLFFFLIPLSYLFFTGTANSNLIEGRFSLHVDEQILFDGVRRILNPDSKEQFLYLLFNGGDHRYGRLFWNINAIICYVPENIFGSMGQIYFSRMSSAFFLISSYIIFTVTFLKIWVFRLIGIITLLAMPYTFYYVSMPKPEPIQLFSLSLFFYFFTKSNWKVNSYYWIFLGLALGAKISTLPIALCITIFTLCKILKDPQYSMDLKHIPKTSFFLFLGLVISVPILMKNFLCSIIFYKVFICLAKKSGIYLTNIKIKIVVFAILLNFIHTYAAYHFFELDTLFKYWLDSTIFNVAHDLDNININYTSWLTYFFNDWLVSPPFYSFIFAYCVISINIAFFYHARNSIRLFDKIFSNKSLLVISGLFSLNLIFLKVERLWGFYILPGFLLIVIGTLMISEYFMDKSNFLKSPLKFQSISYSFILTLLIMLIWWLPMNFEEFQKLSSRTKTKEYKKNYRSYYAIIHELNSISTKKNKVLTVAYDMALFQPTSNKSFHTSPIWGPYTDWENGTDVLVFASFRKNRLNQETDDKKVNYQALIKEKSGYEKFVISDDDSCSKEQCYKRIKTFENGSEILVLE